MCATRPTQFILFYLISLMIQSEVYKWRRPSREFVQTGSKLYCRNASDYMMQSEQMLHLNGSGLLCLIHSKQQKCFCTRQTALFFLGTLWFPLNFFIMRGDFAWLRKIFGHKTEEVTGDWARTGWSGGNGSSVRIFIGILVTLNIFVVFLSLSRQMPG
jgi:hypothetical protein